MRKVLVLLFAGTLVGATQGPAVGVRIVTDCIGNRGPAVLPEPAFTVGLTNTITWEAAAANCWGIGDGADGKPSSRRRWVVFVTDVASGAETVVVVDGAGATSVSLSAAQFPGGGARDGRRYRVQVQRRSRSCASSDKVTRICTAYREDKSELSAPVESTQDATAPSGTFAIEGGAQFTNRLAVNVQLVAADLGAAASGVGFVQFSESASLPCPIQALTCVSSYAQQLQIALASGPDGPRTLYARFFDRARGPGASATPSAFERMPPGNRSASTSDTILVDTKGPALSVTRSAEPAMVNVPVSFDASGSRDEAGFGADSGLDAGTAIWDFGGGTRASGLAVSHTYRAAGTYTTELVVRDRAGNEARTQFRVTVLPSGTPGGATTTTTPPTQTPDTTDRIAPTLAGLGLRRREGRATLLFRLSEQATVVAELRRLRPRPARSLGRVTRAGMVGANRVVLPLSFSRLLRRRGTYELVVVARDASGNASQLRRQRVVTR